MLVRVSVPTVETDTGVCASPSDLMLKIEDLKFATAVGYQQDGIGYRWRTRGT